LGDESIAYKDKRIGSSRRIAVYSQLSKCVPRVLKDCE
jgi:hypothetical protein